jgi:hypothetical protein
MKRMADSGVVLPARVEMGRKIAKGRREHFSGQFTFGPDEGQTMDVESHTELCVAIMCLSRPGVMSIENQVPFEWVGPNGKPAVHHFDFRVLMADGTRRAIMVKSEYRLQQPKVQRELAEIAARVTLEFADEVVVMTERDIDPVEYHNAEIMHEMRRPDPEADAAARRAIGELVGAVQIQDLVDAIDFGSRGFRAVVRLIRSRDLELINHVRISHEAYVYRRIQK